MNILLGVITLVFIFFTGIVIYIKRRKLRFIILNFILFVSSLIALWIGSSATELWLILICSIVIGGSLLVSAIHGYNKLVSSDKAYESIGESRKLRNFGNWYWK